MDRMSPRRALAAIALVSTVAGACSDSRDADDTLPTLPVESAPDDAAPATAAPTTIARTTSPPVTTTFTTAAPTTTAVATTAAPPPPTPAPTTAAPPTAAPTTPPSAETGNGGGLRLRTDGIGVAGFGDQPDAVIAAVQAEIGPPTDDSGWVDPFTIGACPGDRYRQVHWNDLTFDFSDADGRQRFIGYAYGSVSGVGAQPADLTTAEGIGVGATVGDLKAAYPDVTTLPGEEGLFDPRFATTGGLDGYLTGTEDADVVLSIEAGDGCQG
jgi:hypothetical protein